LRFCSRWWMPWKVTRGCHEGIPPGVLGKIDFLAEIVES
jgi:hypothetical protein